MEHRTISSLLQFYPIQTLKAELALGIPGGWKAGKCKCGRLWVGRTRTFTSNCTSVPTSTSHVAVSVYSQGTPPHRL